MSNRRERRAAAAGSCGRKGHKAMRRGGATLGPPAARAIRRAANEFIRGGVPDFDLSVPGFDDAWFGVAPSLNRDMGRDYADFREQTYLDASSYEVVSGVDRITSFDLFLCPVVGEEQSIADYAADPAKLAALAGSFRRNGVFSATSSSVVLPVVIAPEAFSVLATGPAAVDGLVEFAARLTIDALSGRPVVDAEAMAAGMSGFVQVRPLAPPSAPADGQVTIVSGAFVVIRVETRDADASDGDLLEYLASRDDAFDEGLDAWMSDDTFREDGFTICEPMNWPEVGAELAWERCAAFLFARMAVVGGTENGAPIKRVVVSRDPVSGDIHVAACSGQVTVEHLIPIHLACWDVEAVFRKLDGLATVIDTVDGPEAFAALPPYP